MLARRARSSRALRGVAAQGNQKPRTRRPATEDPLDIGVVTFRGGGIRRGNDRGGRAARAGGAGGAALLAPQPSPPSARSVDRAADRAATVRTGARWSSSGADERAGGGSARA